MTQLWSAKEAADYWGVSVSRARAILASRKIKRVGGYPADQVRAVELRQGARTDLGRGDGTGGGNPVPEGPAARTATGMAMDNQQADSYSPEVGPPQDGQGNIKVTCPKGCGRLVREGEHDRGCPLDPQVSSKAREGR